MPCRCGDSRCDCSSKCICFDRNCPCLTCEVTRINENWPGQIQAPPNRSQPQKGDESGNLPVQTCSFSNAASLYGNEKSSANKEMPRENQAFSYFRTADVNVRNSTLHTSQPAGAGTETISSPSCSGFHKDAESHASGSSNSNKNLQRNPGIIEPHKGDGGCLRQLGERGNPTKEKFAAAFKELEKKENVGAPTPNMAKRDANKVSITNPSTSQSSTLTTSQFDPAMSASREQSQMNIPASMFLKRQSLPSLYQESPLDLSKDASVEGNLESRPPNYRLGDQNLVNRTFSDTNRSATTSDKVMPQSADEKSSPLIRKLLSSGLSAQESYQKFYSNPSTTGSTSSASHSSHDIKRGPNQSTGQSTVEKKFSKLNMSSSTDQRTRSEPNLTRKPSSEDFSRLFGNKRLGTESTTSAGRKHPTLVSCLSSPPRNKASNVSASHPPQNVAQNTSSESTSQSTEENKFSKLNKSSSTEQGISSHSESSPSMQPSSEISSQSLRNEPLKNTGEISPEQSLTELNPILAGCLSSPPRLKASNVFTSPSKNPSSNDGQIPQDHPLLRKCLSSPLQTMPSNTCASSQPSSDPATVSAASVPHQEDEIPKHAPLTRSESEPNSSRELLMHSIKELEVLKTAYTSSDYDCANALLSISTSVPSEESASRIRAEHSAGSLSGASSQASASSFIAVSSPGPSSVLSSVSVSQCPNHPQTVRSASLDSSAVSESLMRPPFAPARRPAVGQELRPTQFQNSTTTPPIRRPLPRRSSYTDEESPESHKSVSHKRKKSE